jgi:hypothetical protein
MTPSSVQLRCEGDIIIMHPSMSRRASAINPASAKHTPTKVAYNPPAHISIVQPSTPPIALGQHDLERYLRLYIIGR